MHNTYLFIKTILIHILLNLLPQNVVLVQAGCFDNKRFRYNGVSYKSCNWVAKKKYHRCQLKTKTGVNVSDRCRKTCQNCPFYNNKSVGKLCIGKWNCASNVCKMGTCYASQKCKPIKQQFRQKFDMNVAVLIFVGSGFSALEKWRAQIPNTYSTVKKYEFFDDDNSQFIALYVDELESSFCDYDCGGIRRLLCCNLDITKDLRSKCFPNAGENVQTIVIHNDYEYGGAGYYYDNVATLSINEYGPLVAVHELGHSMFELGDEYPYGNGNDYSPNCDSTGCSKWKDLVDQNAASCLPGFCRGETDSSYGDYSVGDNSFMNILENPIGNVNLRFSCCTYYAITKKFPTYCNKSYFGSATTLLEYCKNDYQHYGLSAYERSNESLSLDKRSASSEGKLVYIARPVHISVEVNSHGYRISTTESSPGLFKKTQVIGDFSELESASKANVSKVIKVTIIFRNDDDNEIVTEMMTLFYSPFRAIVAPPLPRSNNESFNVDYERNDKSNHLMMMVDTLDIVVDDSYHYGQRISNVIVEHVSLSI